MIQSNQIKYLILLILSIWVGAAQGETAYVTDILRLGLHQAQAYFRDGESVIVDGRQGVVLAGADEAVVKEYRKLHRRLERHHAARRKLRRRQRARAIDRTALSRRCRRSPRRDSRHGGGVRPTFGRSRRH